MDGGEISGNTGSGVYVGHNSSFTMDGGEISGNTTFNGAGAVRVNWNGTFIMSGGEISGNTTNGVYFNGNGTFTMSGGEISGNTANGYGGGVYFGSSGTFTMSGGEISGNTASGYYSYGGGVYVGSNGTFIKQAAAVIYGLDADNSLRNTAVTNDLISGSAYGHAVYVETSPAKIRNTTAGTGITLDSSLSGASGGWVDPEISAFSIGSITGTFDGVNVAVVISYNDISEISSLTPLITVPSGVTVSPASGTAQNFNNAVQYTVTTEDGSSAVYTVTVKNSRAKLVTFEFSEPAAIGIIDENTKTVGVTVPYTTNLGALIPAITLSPKASVSPASGEARNFSSPVQYTVTAEDGSAAIYTVTVTPKGQGSVTLVYPDDAASGSLDSAGITISKPSGQQTLQAAGEFDSYRWRVDGVIRSNEKIFVLHAADYTAGGHRISLEVSRDGVAYSKSGSFKVQ
jgi:hypothetical protein